MLEKNFALPNQSHKAISNGVDLQVHSTYSDGSYSPAELFKMAKKQGVQILSITDHDSADSVPESLKAAKRFKISYITGIELTVAYQGNELHLLGYGIDHKNPDLKRLTKFSEKSRAVQIEKMAVKLKELGYQISFGNVKKRAKNLVSRPHLADEVISIPKNKDLFVQKHGKIPDRSLFIQTYIIPGKPAFIKKQYVPIKKGIKVIHKAQGLSFLSHPLGRRFSEGINLSSFSSHWKSVLLDFKKMGLDGIEVYSSDNYIIDQKALYQFAKKYNFLRSGGSDFHNKRIPGLPLGSVSKSRKIPYSVGKNLLKKINPKFTFQAE